MSGPHRFGHHHLYQPGASAVHGLAPQAKLAGLAGFVLAVAVTPRHWVVAFALDAGVLAAVIAAARLPMRLVVVRLAAITPFVAFAFAFPFVGDGDRTDFAGLTLSVDGLWATWNILAKATLGATATIVVTATTPIPDLLTGLARLRVPAVIVGIIAFMFRYLDLIVDELGRIRRAMTARGHDPRWLWQARPLASSAGAVFVRTYEQGERVHDAMAARGFTGTMPELEPHRPARRDWALALTPVLLAVGGIAAIALT